MKKLPIILALISGSLFHSCKKEEIDTEMQTARDFSLVANDIFQIANLVDYVASNTKGIQSLPIGFVAPNFGCMNVTRTGDTTHNSAGTFLNAGNLPKLTIDFATGCLDSTLLWKSGKIEATFKKQNQVIGNHVKIVFINYAWESNKNFKADSAIISRTGTNSISFKVYGGTCSDSSSSDKWTINWNVNTVITQVNPNDNLKSYYDNVIAISGTVNGTNSDKKERRNYSGTINSPLIKAASCRYISGGKITLSPDRLYDKVVEYGNGECDNKATSTAGGNTYSFKM